MFRYPSAYRGRLGHDDRTPLEQAPGCDSFRRPGSGGSTAEAQITSAEQRLAAVRARMDQAYEDNLALMQQLGVVGSN